VGRRAKPKAPFDRELAALPAPLRRREFMMRIEAVIFAASQPVPRQTLTALIGSDCHLDPLIDEIRDELRARPYELVAVAGGYQHRTRRAYADVICASGTVAKPTLALSETEGVVLTAIAYFQPVTRSGIGDLLGKPVSRDVIAALRSTGLVGTGPRSPQPGAPHTYVTTPAFLSQWGLDSLRDLPDLDRLEEAGLLGKAPLPDGLRSALGLDSQSNAVADVVDIEADQEWGAWGVTSSEE
jgi:chromosome segregation and condensation protein ScpB